MQTSDVQRNEEVARRFFDAVGRQSASALEELLAPSVSLIVWGERGTEVLRPRSQAIERLLSGGREWLSGTFELLHLHGDGAGIWVEFRTHVLRDERPCEMNGALRLELDGGCVRELRQYLGQPVPTCWRALPDHVNLSSPDVGPLTRVLETFRYLVDARAGPGDFLNWSLSRQLGVQYGGRPSPFVNVVWGARFSAAEADERIAETVNRFRQIKAAFHWRVHTLDTPHDLGLRLERAGLMLSNVERVMVAPPGTSIQGGHGVEVEWVRPDDKHGFDAACDLFVEGGLVPVDGAAAFRSVWSSFVEGGCLDVFLARLGAEAVGACSLFVPGKTTAAAMLSGAVVRRAFRNRGIYRAMLARRIDFARGNNCRIAFVEAGAESYPIVAKLGFLECGTLRQYTWSPPAAA